MTEISDTTGAMTAEFVADVRRSYVPAIRWLRTNGWRWTDLGFRNQQQMLGLEWSNALTAPGEIPYISVNAITKYERVAHCKLLANISSAAQAVDLLVTAGVLPTEFHNLSISGCCAVDSDCRNGCPDEVTSAEDAARVALYERNGWCRAWCGEIAVDDGGGYCAEHASQQVASVTA